MTGRQVNLLVHIAVVVVKAVHESFGLVTARIIWRASHSVCSLHTSITRVASGNVWCITAWKSTFTPETHQRILQTVAQTVAEAAQKQSLTCCT